MSRLTASSNEARIPRNNTITWSAGTADSGTVRSTTITQQELLDRIVVRAFDPRADLIDASRDDEWEGLSDEEIERWLSGTGHWGGDDGRTHDEVRYSDEPLAKKLRRGLGSVFVDTGLFYARRETNLASRGPAPRPRPRIAGRRRPTGEERSRRGRGGHTRPFANGGVR